MRLSKETEKSLTDVNLAGQDPLFHFSEGDKSLARLLKTILHCTAYCLGPAALVFAAPPPPGALGFPADGARCEGCLLAPELGCLVGDLGLVPVNVSGDRPLPEGLVVAPCLAGDLVGAPCFEVAVAAAVPVLAAAFDGVVDFGEVGLVLVVLLAAGLPPVSVGLLLTGEVGRPDLC